MNFFLLIGFTLFSNFISLSLSQTEDDDYPEGSCVGSNRINREFINVENYHYQDYLQLEEIYDLMAHLGKNSEYVNTINIGKTYENRYIKVLKIDFNGSNYRPKKAIVIEAGLRPKSWASIATATYIMGQLINSDDPDIKYIARQYVWYIAPVLNPDGNAYTWQESRCWMFNRKPYGRCVGADLTRNFPYDWTYVGRDKYFCRGPFHGHYPLCELETRSWATFLTKIQQPLYGYFQFLTYGSKLKYPTNARNGKLRRFGINALEGLKRAHGVTFGLNDTNLTGTSVAWVAHKFEDIELVYTYNVRGANSVLPPEELIPAADEIFESIVSIIFQAQPPESEYPVHFS